MLRRACPVVRAGGPRTGTKRRIQAYFRRPTGRRLPPTGEPPGAAARAAPAARGKRGKLPLHLAIPVAGCPARSSRPGLRSFPAPHLSDPPAPVQPEPQPCRRLCGGAYDGGPPGWRRTGFSTRLLVHTHCRILTPVPIGQSSVVFLVVFLPALLHRIRSIG